MRKPWVTLAFLLCTPQMQAAPHHKRHINSISLSGPGCNDVKDRQILMTPDERVVSVFFNNFKAETTESDRQARLHCHMKIMLDLPAGLTVRLDTVDYRGYAYPSVAPDEDGSVQVTGKAQLKREYFFGNHRLGIERSNTYIEDTEFTERDELFTTVSSTCGGRVLLQTHITAFATRGQDATEQTTIGVDTLDLKREFEQIIKLSYVSCQ